MLAGVRSFIFGPFCPSPFSEVDLTDNTCFESGWWYFPLRTRQSSMWRKTPYIQAIQMIDFKQRFYASCTWQSRLPPFSFPKCSPSSTHGVSFWISLPWSDLLAFLHWIWLQFFLDAFNSFPISRFSDFPISWFPDFPISRFHDFFQS